MPNNNSKIKQQPKTPVQGSVDLKQFPKKAREIVLYFETHTDTDPLFLAQSLGFESHTEMHQYMKLCGLRYHSRTGKYCPANEFQASYIGTSPAPGEPKVMSTLRNKRCTFFLSEHTLEQLESYAKKQQLSKSEVFELALQEFLQKS